MDEMPPVNVRTTKRDGDGLVGNKLRKRRKERSALTISLEMELRKICEKNVSVGVAVNEYKERMKDSA